MKPPREIHLHIERLVLDGLPIDRSQGAFFTAALEAELAKLFAAPGMLAHAGAALASVVAQPIHMGKPMSPAAAGAQIARAVHRAVTQTLASSSAPRPQVTQHHPHNSTSHQPATRSPERAADDAQTCLTPK